ncbi:unnamed protein product [Closterium sp. NIES-64]|nr:unnamed protein product [Closterium sp. NIES-64]
MPASFACLLACHHDVSSVLSTISCFSRSFPPSLIHITTNQPTNQVNSTLASLERNADVASLTQQQTTCSCYRVRNDYCCYQYMCKCSPMCWNGYQPISLGEPKCAPATEHAPPQPGQPPVLTPVSCAEQHTFRSALYSCFPETSEGGLGVRSTGEGGGGSGGGGEGGERGGGRGGEGWLGSRSGVDWRFGQTMLQTFSQSEGNIAHFSQKVFTLLLANNFTASAALQSTVNRLMLPRSPQFIERIRTIGADSMFARVMQAMIEFAVTPLLASRVHNSPELLAHKTLGDLPMAFGLVEFESAWNAATESRPLCFESLLLPGIFKGMVFPSHPDQGTYLERHLRIKLGLKPPEKMVWGADGARGWRPRVLYITRLGAELKGRRCFVPESHEALLRLMNDLDFQLHVLLFIMSVSPSHDHRLASVFPITHPHTPLHPSTHAPSPIRTRPPSPIRTRPTIHPHTPHHPSVHAPSPNGVPLSFNVFLFFSFLFHLFVSFPHPDHKACLIQLFCFHSSAHALSPGEHGRHGPLYIPLSTSSSSALLVFPLIHPPMPLLRVTMVEMGHLTFRQQFEAIQSADIIISPHSASFMNVPLFACCSSVHPSPTGDNGRDGSPHIPPAVRSHSIGRHHHFPPQRILDERASFRPTQRRCY